jgi:signal transduction histidine kinase
VKLKLIHKGLILVSVPLVCGLIFVATLSAALKESERETRMANQSKALVAEAQNLSKVLLDAGTSLVAWKYMRSSTFLKKYDESEAQIMPIAQNLEKLTQPNTPQRRHVEKLRQQAERILSLTNAWRKQTGVVLLQDPHAFKEDVDHAYREFMLEIKALTDCEQANLLSQPFAEQQARERVEQVLWAGVIFNVAVTLAMAVYFSRSISNRLDVLSQNARLLSNRKPLHKLIGGEDEVADLDRVFHEMADALVKAERRKQDFVSMISHDLRTPLCSLQTTLALLARGVYGQINEKGHDRVIDAERESDRLIGLISELLDIDKIEAGKLELNPRQIDLTQTIRRAINAVESIAEKRAMKINFHAEPSTITADDDRLMQVMVNLLSNAIKYSAEGTEVNVEVFEEPGKVKVVVEDHGRGIPPDVQGKIFEPFEQVGVSEDGTPSTGLGLAIARAVITAHGGAIGVQSEVSVGSKFWFTLPSDTAKDAVQAS